MNYWLIDGERVIGAHWKGRDNTFYGWAQELGFADGCLRRRWQRGWSVEDALGKPPDRRNKVSHHEVMTPERLEQIELSRIGSMKWS